MERRVERLTLYAMWRPPTRIDFISIVDPKVWERHRTNWRNVLDLLQESQKLAKEIREMVAAAPRYRNPVTGEVTYTTQTVSPTERKDDEPVKHRDVVERINHS